MNRYVPIAPALSNTSSQILRGSISACIACAAILAIAFTTKSAHAQFAVAGSLTADLRADELSSANTTWLNNAPAATSVGDFGRADLGNLTVETINGNFNGSPISLPALSISSTAANSLVSALNVPTGLTGNGSRSVEAWVLAPDAAGTQGVLSWGIRGSNNMMSRFSYNSGNFGMISGWFNDSTWTGPLVTGDLVHVVWTYDGTTARGYLNGSLNTTFAHPAPLQTPASLMYIGTAPGGNNDPFHGYISAIRVHTGVLNDTQVLNNYDLGPIIDDGGLACDFDGSGTCNSADFATLTNNLFTSGGKAMGDMNLDGFIDLKDLRAFKDHPDRVIGGAGAGAATTVPEPASIAIVGFICVVLASVRRSRSAKA